MDVGANRLQTVRERVTAYCSKLRAAGTYRSGRGRWGRSFRKIGELVRAGRSERGQAEKARIDLTRVDSIGFRRCLAFGAGPARVSTAAGVPTRSRGRGARPSNRSWIGSTRPSSANLRRSQRNLRFVHRLPWPGWARSQFQIFGRRPQSHRVLRPDPGGASAARCYDPRGGCASQPWSTACRSTGLNAMPIVGLLSFLIGIVVAIPRRRCARPVRRADHHDRHGRRPDLARNRNTDHGDLWSPAAPAAPSPPRSAR